MIGARDGAQAMAKRPTMSHPTNLEIDVLRSFVAGVQLNSFARAAKLIGRSQSAVSLHLRKLEQQTGQVLFRKAGRGLHLTDAGETLLRYAQKLINLNDEALSAVAGDDVSGRVRVGLPPDLAETWLPDLLGRFARSHPTVAVEARVERNAVLLEALDAGALDVALFWCLGEDGTQRPGRLLAEFPIVWIVPAGFAPDDQARLPLVLMGAPCLFAAKAIAALEESGRPWRSVFTSTSLSGIWAAISAELGVTVRTPLSVPAGLHILASGGLPELGRASLRLRAADAPSRSVQRFIDILEATVAAAPSVAGSRIAPNVGRAFA
ncbi:LysR substrate-binding domain-containing protein [Methylopila henanensis]|uniref:LysR substrate-binding domain-containing protein n=1 Tax=Methylopila henanensis TaxID=873516 RepID=A0ABW4K921_9HYPH